MYALINHPTKKAFRESVNGGVFNGIYQPNDMFSNPKAAQDYTGPATIEGPHYPKAHSWYASVNVINGAVVSVK